MPVTWFPPELLERILSEVHQDIPTLKAFALASRYLTHLSHQHLFSHVLIRSPGRSHQYRLRVIQGSPSQFEVLLRKSPHIGGYVRCLIIFDCPSYDANAQRTSHWLHNDSHLQHCLPRLQSLEALVMKYRGIERQDWKELPTPLVMALYGVLQLPSLHYLDLEGSPTFSLLHVAAKNVKHLTTHGVSQRFSDIENLGAHDEMVFIESLHITQSSLATILPALTDEIPANVSMQKLKKLLFHAAGMGPGLDNSGQVLAEILQRFGSSLEELMLWPNPGADEWAQDRNLTDFSLLKVLKRLHVQLNYEKLPYETEVNNIPWFIAFLKNSLGSLEQLEMLDISVYYDPDPGRTVVDWLVSVWDDLAEVLLDSKRFPRLKDVCMRIASSEMQREIWEATKLSKFVKTIQSSTIGLDLQHGLSCLLELQVLNPEWSRRLTGLVFTEGTQIDA